MSDNRAVKRPSPMLVYSASRFGVLLACLVVLYVLGARQLLLVALALLLSMLLSYVLLRGQREALASSVLERREKLRQRAGPEPRRVILRDDQRGGSPADAGAAARPAIAPGLERD